MSVTMNVHKIKTPEVVELTTFVTIDIPFEGGVVQLFVKDLDEATSFGADIIIAADATRKAKEARAAEEEAE